MDSTTTTLRIAVSEAVHENPPEDVSPAIQAMAAFSDVLCHYLQTGVIANNEQAVFEVARMIEAEQLERKREEEARH